MKQKKFMALLIASCMTIMVGCGSVENTDAVQANKATEVNELAQEETKAEEEKRKAEEEAQKAEEEAKRIAEQKIKDAESACEEGRNALYGLNGEKVDYEKAYNSFQRALELDDNKDAIFYLGVLTDWYSYPKQDFEAAKEYYEKAGDNPYAQISLGCLYLNGMGVDEDVEKANEIFQRVVDGGCVEGYLGLGYSAYYAKNNTEAVDCLTKVFEEGTEQVYVAGATHSMGQFYEMGIGVEKNYDTAIGYYEKAKELHNTSAIIDLASLYLTGEGVAKDIDRAIELYEEAAELGDALGFNTLGMHYHNGDGVKRDYKEAIKWFEKAAEYGNDWGMYNLSNYYRIGEWGVERDENKAIEWALKAAEAGNDSIVYFDSVGEGTYTKGTPIDNPTKGGHAGAGETWNFSDGAHMHLDKKEYSRVDTDEFGVTYIEYREGYNDISMQRVKEYAQNLPAFQTWLTSLGNRVTIIASKGGLWDDESDYNYYYNTVQTTSGDEIYVYLQFEMMEKGKSITKLWSDLLLALACKYQLR